jgi:hypothetical protein
VTAQAAEAAVVRVNPRWGENYGSERAAYHTSHDGSVWMHRKGQKVRFFDATGKQVGPEHRNVYPAMIWAAAAGWIDPSAPMISIACNVEVRKQLEERAAMDPKTRRELDKIDPAFSEARCSRDRHRPAPRR